MVTLLFVHLGKKIPSYLKGNIERSRDIFPDIKIALVSDTSPSVSWLSQNNITHQPFESNESFESIFSYGEYQEEFRKGYWRHTIERLLALEIYHNENPKEKILHIESDVILFSNFPFELLADTKNVSWMRHSNNADIATIVFSPSPRQTSKFSQDLIEAYKAGGGSDMDVLFRMRNSSSIYHTFPIIHENIPQFKNPYNSSNFIQQIENVLEAPGIFDAAGIGMWVTGVDPRNKFGFTVICSRELIDSGTILVDPSQATYSLLPNKTLEIKIGEKSLPIYNLHVHSKNKEILSRNWESQLLSFINKNTSRNRTVDFQPSILCSLVLESIKQGTLKSFLSHIPLIKSIKQRFSSV